MTKSRNHVTDAEYELSFDYILTTLLLSILTVLSYNLSSIVSVQFIVLTFITLLVCKHDGIFKTLILYISFIPMFIILISLLSPSGSLVLFPMYEFLDKMNIGFTLSSTRLTYLILITILAPLALVSKSNNRILIPKVFRYILTVSLFLLPIVLLIVR